MPDILKDKTVIPNWLMSIVVLVIVSVFAFGFRKIEVLENKVITNQVEVKHQSEQLNQINRKIDFVISKLTEKD